MALTSEHVETDTREKILVVAERLFRQIGYQKTTVADIAKELRMSPANVYRFFDSKKSIHEGVARPGETSPARAAHDHQPDEHRALCRRFQAARDGRDRDGGGLGRLRRPYRMPHRHHRPGPRGWRGFRRIRGPRPAAGGALHLHRHDPLFPPADDRA